MILTAGIVRAKKPVYINNDGNNFNANKLIIKLTNYEYIIEFGNYLKLR